MDEASAQTSRVLTLALAGLAAIALFFGGAHFAAAQKDGGKTAKKQRAKPAGNVIIDYDGKLQDENGEPISGVFSLRFKIYEGEDSARPDWNEKHFVGVVNGAYTVPLGRYKPLHRERIPEKPWIGVELVGEGEILRDRLEVGGEKHAPTKSSGDKTTISAETKELLEKAKKSGNMAFADVAERAVKADQAKIADRAEAVGDMSAQEIEQASQKALKKLGEHIADPNAHQAAGGLRVGKERKYSDQVGGDGGRPYEVNCPPGHVVTGIKGGSGRLVDSITLICKPLR